MGTIRIIMNINGEQLPATIPNVLYVPDMSSTLISVTNLTKREHTLYFKKEWCDIWTLGGRLVGCAKCSRLCQVQTQRRQTLSSPSRTICCLPTTHTHLHCINLGSRHKCPPLSPQPPHL